VKVGHGVVLYFVDELESWLAARRQTSTAETPANDNARRVGRRARREAAVA
jgi:hypothetical protein